MEIRLWGGDLQKESFDSNLTFSQKSLKAIIIVNEDLVSGMLMQSKSFLFFSKLLFATFDSISYDFISFQFY